MKNMRKQIERECITYQNPDQTPGVRVSGIVSEWQNSLVLKGDHGYETRSTSRHRLTKELKM